MGYLGSSRVQSIWCSSPLQPAEAHRESGANIKAKQSSITATACAARALLPEAGVDAVAPVAAVAAAGDC